MLSMVYALLARLCSPMKFSICELNWVILFCRLCRGNTHRLGHPRRSPDARHQDCYTLFSHHCFAESRKIDWNVLHEVGLDQKVQQMLSTRAWRQFFLITDNTYEQLALEVLATTQFLVFGTLQRMSLTEFSIPLILYDTKFTWTPTYDSLLISWPIREPLEHVWRRLSTNPAYDPHQSKATTLCAPVLRYIYFFLSHTLKGCDDNTSIISWINFYFLQSMLDWFDLHLGYEVW